jgi:hypothetical protein
MADRGSQLQAAHIGNRSAVISNIVIQDTTAFRIMYQNCLKRESTSLPNKSDSQKSKISCGKKVHPTRVRRTLFRHTETKNSTKLRGV